MLKTASFLLAGLIVGFAVASWWGGEARAPSSGAAGGSAPFDERLAALEGALRDEQLRRFELEAELDELEQTIAALAPAPDDRASAGARALSRGNARPADAPPEFPADDTVPPPLRAELMNGPRARFGRDDDELVERFVANGISADRAQWIVQRTSELRMEALQAQYEAAREGTPLDPRATFAAPNALRDELGDADYERYLQALDRPTSVGVRDVLPSSPAAQAGLQPGDQVVAYSGTRVFDMSDLNRLVLEGQPGQTVTIEVLRDGQPMQLYVPRGPLGITGGGRFRGPGGR
jgi:hypothetical protein